MNYIPVNVGERQFGVAQELAPVAISILDLRAGAKNVFALWLYPIPI